MDKYEQTATLRLAKIIKHLFYLMIPFVSVLSDMFKEIISVLSMLPTVVFTLSNVSLK